jgi:hypothetical protein
VGVLRVGAGGLRDVKGAKIEANSLNQESCEWVPVARHEPDVFLERLNTGCFPPGTGRAATVRVKPQGAGENRILRTMRYSDGGVRCGCEPRGRMGEGLRDVKGCRSHHPRGRIGQVAE